MSPMPAPPDVRPLASVDGAEVERLLDRAFGADRRGRTAYRLREGMAAIGPLSFAVIESDALVASLQSWPIALHPAGGAPVPLILVGPVAVTPQRQGRGLGRALMGRLIGAAAGADPLVLIGDPGYYGRFGFSADPTGGWSLPGPVERHRLLARGGEGLPVEGMLGPRGVVPPGRRTV